MAGLKDIKRAAVREIGSAYSIGLSVLDTDAAATYSTVQSPAGSLISVINGVPRLVTDVTNKALATLAALQQPITHSDGYYTLPAAKTCYFLVVVDASANWYAIQGTYSGQVLYDAGGRPFYGDGSIPQVCVPDTYAVVGAIKVVNDATHTFVPGTTVFNNSTDNVATTVSLNRGPNAVPTFA